jgi:hypothetical protein
VEVEVELAEEAIKERMELLLLHLVKALLEAEEA